MLSKPAMTTTHFSFPFMISLESEERCRYLYTLCKKAFPGKQHARTVAKGFGTPSDKHSLIRSGSTAETRWQPCSKTELANYDVIMTSNGNTQEGYIQ